MTHTVSMLWTLYKKDLRQMRGIALALVGYGIGTHCLSIFFNYIIPSYSLHNVLYDITQTMPFVFPTLLAYILYQNHHDETIYQAQSLPLWRGTQIITTYVAFMTYVLIYLLLTQFLAAFEGPIHLYSMYHTFQVSINNSGQEVTMSMFEYVLRALTYNIAHMPLTIANLSGMVCLAAGIVSPLSVKKDRLYWI